MGPSILAALDAEAHLNVSILSRQESTSTYPSHVKVHKTDYSETSLISAFKGQDAVVSTVSGPGIRTQTSIVDAAIKAGVKRFIPSEFGSNTANQKALELVPVFKGKESITSYLKSKESDGISWTSLLNGPFFDWYGIPYIYPQLVYDRQFPSIILTSSRGLQTGFLEFDLKSQTATICDDGTNKWSTTTLSTVGKAVVSILLHPAETKNKYIYIASFTVSQNEVLAAVEKASGKKWEVIKTTSNEQMKIGQEKMIKHDYSGVKPLILAATYGEGRGSNFASGESLSNDMLGLPKEDLDEVVAKVIKGEKV